MRFDNKDFESNVKTSLGTLDKLNQALRFKNAESGFDNLSKASKNVDLSGIASGVAALEKRFSALGIIGMRVLENLTDTAMQFAGRAISFATEGIVQGGINRAMNIEKAHFQLQGLLKDEEKVQAVMDDAMNSVDGTAYAFDAAAMAASQFAASGMEAGEQMQSSLRAITGVAAMTNSEYESISRIFTTVAGNGRLMGDQLLQLSTRGLNAAASLKEYFNGINDGSITASDSVTSAVKVLSNGLAVSEEDIRGWVSAGEISFEMFSAAMDDAFGEHAKKANETVTGALSNIKASLARIGAEFVSPLVVQNGPLVQFFNALRERINDVKKSIGPLATLFTDSVTAMANSATKFLQELDLSKHFTIFYHLLDTAKNALGVFKDALSPVAQAFREIFPKTMGEPGAALFIDRVVTFSEKLKALSENFKIGDETADKLKRTFRGLFAVVDIAKQALSALGEVVKPLLGYLPGMGDGILGVTAALGDGLYALDQWLKKNEVFADIAFSISGAFQYLREDFLYAFGSIKDVLQRFHEMLAGIISDLKTVFNGFDEIDLSGVDSFVDQLKERFHPVDALLEGFRLVLRGIVTLFQYASQALPGIIQKTLYVFENFGTVLTAALAILTGRALVAAVSGLKKILGAIASFYTTKIANPNALLKIAGSIAILCLSLALLSTIDPERLAAATTAMTLMFTELIASFQAFKTVLSGKGFSLLPKLAVGISAVMGLALAMLVLAAAMRVIGSMDDAALMKSVVAIGTVLTELLVFTKFFTVNKGITKGVMSLIILAAALRMLVKPIQEIGDMDPEVLVRGLIGLGALLTELAVFLKFADFDGVGVMKGLGLILMAQALKIMATAVAAIGALDINTLARGLTAIGIALLLIGGYSALLSGTKNMLSSAISLLIISEALTILARAIREVGSIEPETIVRGLLAIASALAAIVGAMRLMPKNILANALGLVVIGAALKIITGVLADMGNMQMSEIGKGLLALGGALLAIAVAVRVMSGAMSGAAALLIVSAALAILAPILKSLGSMSLKEVGIALLALAGSFVVLGVAGLALAPMIPVLLALGAVVTLLGIGFAITAAATLLFSTALTALAISGAAGAAALAGAIITVANTIPAVMKQVGEGIAELIKVIGDNAPAIVEAVVKIAKAIIEGARELIPAFVDGLLYLIEEVLLALSVHAPQIVTYLMDFLIGVINALAERLPELIVAAVNLIGAFFRGIVDALKGIDVSTLVDAIAGVGLISLLLLALSALSALIPAAMVGVLGVGAVIAEMALVLAAVGAFAQIPGLEWLINEGGDFLAAVGSAIGKFIGGIAGGVLEGATSALPKIGEDLSAFMENAKGFIDGAKEIDADMMAGVKALAETVLILTAANVLDGLSRWFTGGNSLTKFGEELSDFGPYIRQYARDVAGVDTSVVTASANAASILSEMAAKLPNSGGAVSLFTGDNKLSDFGKELAAFGPYISEYARAVGDVKPEAIEASVNAARAMSELANGLPNAGGVASWFTGDNTLSEFGQELAKFAPHIATYSSHVKDVDAGAVRRSVGAVTSLAEIAEAIPNSGGAISLFTGDNTLGKFGENLANLGAALSRYSSSLANVSLELVKKGTDALRELVDMAQGMKNVSFAQMANFSHNLKLLADGGIEKFVQAFSDAKAQVKAAVIEFVTAAAQSMKDKKGELKSAAEEVCTVIQQAMDENFQAERFGANGRQLGAALALGVGESANLARATVLAVFREAMASLDQLEGDFKMKGSQAAGWLLEGFSSGSATAGGGLTKLSDAFLSMVDGLKQSFQSRGSLIAEWVNEGVAAAVSKIESVTKNLGQAFLSVIDGMKPDFTGRGNSIAGWAIDGLNASLPGMESAAGGFGRAFLTVVDGMKSEFTGRGTALAAHVVEGVQSALPRMEAAAKGFGAAFLAAIDGMKKEFSRRGTQLIGWLNEGIASGIPQVETTASNVGQAFLSKLSGMRSAFNQAGSQMISGLNAGLSGGIAAVQNAASSVGQSMLSSLNQTLGIKSPSKEGERIGVFMDQGLILGLLGHAKQVDAAGETVGNSLTAALNDSLAGLSEDMLSDPVIRPVVDLSDVERSAGMIGSMFGTGQTLALAGNVSAGMHAYANQRNQNDLGSVVTGLKNEVASMRETIGDLKRSLAAQREDGNLAGSVGSAVREALSGVSVSMDGQRVGRLVTNHQNSSTRRHGTPSVLR